MGAVEIALLILQNAPTILKTADEVFEWGKATWAGVQEATSKPAEEITKEELLAHIAQIKVQSAEIQGLG